MGLTNFNLAFIGIGSCSFGPVLDGYRSWSFMDIVSVVKTNIGAAGVTIFRCSTDVRNLSTNGIYPRINQRQDGVYVLPISGIDQCVTYSSRDRPCICNALTVNLHNRLIER